MKPLFLGSIIRAAAAMAVALPLTSLAQARIEALHGEELYRANCGACHDERVHWRAGKLASDWDALVLQVRRWQGVLGLGWRDEEIISVAHHLNQAYYQYPAPPRITRRPDSRQSAVASADLRAPVPVDRK